MSAPYISASDTSAVGMNIVDRMVQAYLAQNAVLMNTVLDRSEMATKGVKAIDIGRRTQLTAQTKQAETPLTGTAFTWSADQLALDKHEAVYTILEDAADVQSTVAQEPAILESSIQALLQKLEDAIYAELVKAHASNTIKWKTASTISLADIVEARKLLNKNNVPFEDRFLAINPDQEAQILALKNFTEAAKYGDNMPLINGEIGRIYGFRVVVTNTVAAGVAVAYHRSHVAFARQINLVWERQRSLKNAGTEYLLQQKYGVKVLDQGLRGVKISD